MVRRQLSVDQDGWLHPCVQFVKLCRQGDPDFLHKHYNAAYPVLAMVEDALSSQGKT
jgi:hypothetical protein